MTSEPLADPKLAELVAALPEELSGPAERRAELAELLEALAQKPVPTGRVPRLWALGTLQARVAVAYGLCAVRGLFAGADERTRLRNDAHLKSAVQLLGGMGYLRGAIMKLGQTIASYPDLVPEEYIDVLGALHFEAPPMHFSLLREQVRRELGADPEDLFAEFDTHAFAAASLGQVHRARTRNGQEVAVKVQYPNIGRTITADLANMKALLTPMRLMRDWDNLMECLEEVRETMSRETDYEREADTADRVRAEFADLDDIVVPRVHRDLSTARVLTLDLVRGAHLPELLAGHPSQERRDLHGAQVMRVVARLLYAKLVLADPNPGNFLFLEDGRLGVIDFGCYRALEGRDWDIFLRGDAAVVPTIAGGDEALREVICDGTLMTADEVDDDRFAHLRATVDWLWEPFATDEPFDFGDEAYMRRGIDAYSSLMRRYGYHRQLPVFLWTNRTFAGVRALAYAMGSRVPLKRINDAERERAGIRHQG